MGILSSLVCWSQRLNANGTALSVIGNNIANLSTVGFKGSKATFADLISSSISEGQARFRPASAWLLRPCRGISLKDR